MRELFPRTIEEWRALLLVPLITALIVVAPLTIIGSIQANQYKEVVERIDRNSALSHEGVAATVCILRIEPDQRNSRNVGMCMDDYTDLLEESL